MIYPHVDIDGICEDQTSDLYLLVKEIDQLVLDSAEMAYNLEELNSSNPKQREWIGHANQYISGTTSDFLYSSYGSAVEELTNQRIEAEGLFYENDGQFKISLQETIRGTRPDIVIRDGHTNEMLAWLDITSSNNIEHIAKKADNWLNKDFFVAEILYPKLDVRKIKISDDVGIGTRAKTLAIARKIGYKKGILVNYMLTRLGIALRKLSYRRFNKAELVYQIEKAFGCSFLDTKHGSIKAMLKKYVEYKDNFDFLARKILNRFYTGERPRANWAAALRYINQSYLEYRENDSPYVLLAAEDLNDWESDSADVDYIPE